MAGEIIGEFRARSEVNTLRSGAVPCGRTSDQHVFTHVALARGHLANPAKNGFRPERVTFGKLKHEVRVEVTRPDLSVRARKTYFEDPQQGK
jgi:hypothetical protein